MRLSLGSAQFGLDYGISNTSGKVNPDTVEEIILTARRNNISHIDSAPAYGIAEEVLGSCGIKDFKVTTKVTLKKDSKFSSGVIEESIDASLERLQINSLHGVLVHNPEVLFEYGGEAILDALIRIRNSGLIERVGISVYRPNEMHRLLKLYDFDIVQVPLSIVDTRFIRPGILEDLRQKKVEVQLRSVFLQGLLLSSKMQFSSKFIKWAHYWRELRSFILQQELSPLEACVGFARDVSNDAQIIVGTESKAQLLEIIEAYGKASPIFWPNWNCEDEQLLVPSLW